MTLKDSDDTKDGKKCCNTVDVLMPMLSAILQTSNMD